MSRKIVVVVARELPRIVDTAVCTRQFRPTHDILKCREYGYVCMYVCSTSLRLLFTRFYGTTCSTVFTRISDLMVCLSAVLVTTGVILRLCR